MMSWGSSLCRQYGHQGLTAEGKLPIFGWGDTFPSKFDIVISKTPFYEGMMGWILK